MSYGRSTSRPTIFNLCQKAKGLQAQIFYAFVSERNEKSLFLLVGVSLKAQAQCTEWPAVWRPCLQFLAPNLRPP